MSDIFLLHTDPVHNLVSSFINFFIKDALIIMFGRKTGQIWQTSNEYGHNDKDSCIIHNHTNNCDAMRHLCLPRHILLSL